MSVTIDVSYPAVMNHKLRLIRRRRLALGVLRAAILAATVLVVAMLIAAGIDWWFTLFHPAARVALTVLALTAAGVTLLATAARPIRRSLGLRRVAEDVDQDVPQLQQRWSTVAELAESRGLAEAGLAGSMKRLVTREAVAMGRLVEPARVASINQARRACCWLLASLLLLAGFLWVDPTRGRILLRRFWAPLTPLTATQVTSLSGDVVRPRGEPLDLTFRIGGVPAAQATLQIVEPTGQMRSLPLPLTDSDTVVYQIASLQSSFRYRLQAGDGRTHWHTATAIDRPALARVRLTVAAPEYLDRPVFEKPYLPPRITAVEGSLLSLELEPTLPLQRLELVLSRPAGDPAVPPSRADDAVQRWTLTADADGRYRYQTVLDADLSIQPALVSARGLAGDDQPKCSIHVVADQAPVARISTPDQELTVSPDQVIDIHFDAHDDHGIAQAELVVYQESATPVEPAMVLDVQPIPLGDQHMARHVRATAQLDLARLPVTTGANLSFAIRVRDNRPLAPTAPTSRTLAAADSPPPSQQAAASAASAAATSAADVGEPTDPTDPTEAAASGDPGDAGDAGDATAAPPGGPTADVRAAVAEAGRQRGDDAVAASMDAPTTQESPLDQPPPDGRVAMRGAKSPVAKPPVAEPSVAKSPVAKPPVAEPSVAESPVAKSPVAESSVAESSDAESPVAEAPVAKSPVAGPPNAGSSNAGTRSAEARDAEMAVATAPNQAAAGAEEGQETEEAAGAGGIEGTAAGVEREAAVAMSRKDAAARGERDGAEPPAAAAPAEGSAAANDTAAASAAAAKTETAATPADDGVSLGDPGPPRPWSVVATEEAFGQRSESNRLRLRIAELVVPAAPVTAEPQPERMNLRDRVLQIDGQLEIAAADLERLWQAAAAAGTADAQVADIQAVDQRLVQIDRSIAELRDESRETQFAFVGLQMVEIGNSHLTPAQDRIFAVLRQPGAGAQDHLARALHHVSRAREQLAELLVRYDRAAREEELAESLEDVATMYEVYVAQMQQLLRGQREPSSIPIERQMAILDIDQRYLDRLKEVLEMRRELLAEFSRILADDPRLLSKFMDIVRRRQTSLRDQLSKLHQRQTEIAEELAGWRNVDSAQRDAVWLWAAELRLHEAAQVVAQASQLEQRIVSQFPLGIDRTLPVAASVIERAGQLAVQARATAVVARRMLADPLAADGDLTADVSLLSDHLSGLEMAIDRLEADQPSDETREFAVNRRAEIGPLVQQFAAWHETAEHLRHQRYHGLAKVDQQQLTIRTEQLRLAMQDIEAEFAGQFQQEMPASVLTQAEELKRILEGITFNQMAAVFDLDADRLDAAQGQLDLALSGFARAEALFDALRRAIVEQLDQLAPDDPNIADLQDPTLDQILIALEREPDLAALLGIPDRPTNLRVLSDWMQWSDDGSGVGQNFDAAVAEARRRAQQQQRWNPPRPEGDDQDADMTEQQWREVADAEQAGEKLRQQADELRRRADDPQLDEQQQEQLRRAANQLQQLQQQLADQENGQVTWQQMVRSDQMKAVLRAAARGEAVPDSQWNQIRSSLDDGLWQVQRRTPPEAYRRAIEQYQQRVRQLRGQDNVSWVQP